MPDPRPGPLDALRVIQDPAQADKFPTVRNTAATGQGARRSRPSPQAMPYGQQPASLCSGLGCPPATGFKGGLLAGHATTFSGANLSTSLPQTSQPGRRARANISRYGPSAYCTAR